MRMRTLAVSMCGILAACESKAIIDPTPDELAFGEAEITGLLVRTEHLGMVDGILLFDVEFRNIIDQQLEVIVSGSCVMRLLMHDNQSREGSAVWDARRDGTDCAADGVDLTLAPGGARKVRHGVAVQHILGDSLGGRTYFFSAVVAVEDESVVMPAGHGYLSRRR